MATEGGRPRDHRVRRNRDRRRGRPRGRRDKSAAESARRDTERARPRGAGRACDARAHAVVGPGGGSAAHRIRASRTHARVAARHHRWSSPSSAGHRRSPVVAHAGPHRPPRSEEHTSELQSLTNLVCRLLLEKKKKKQTQNVKKKEKDPMYQIQNI